MLSAVVLCVGVSKSFAAQPAFPSSTGGKASGEISFKKTQLDAKFRSEGVAVADFNRDGKLDVAAGSVWYEAPSWKMHSILEKPREFQPKGYSNAFNNWAEDINGDKWPDLLAVEWPGKRTLWFENPGTSGGSWKPHVITTVTNTESPQLIDIDGDGRRELVCAFSPDPANSDGPNRRMAIISRSKNAAALWKIRPISVKAAPNTTRYSHGLGVGDINGDGRNDVVIPQGWWESPAKGAKGEWKFHPAPLGQAAADMRVYDFDGDGDADVLSSSAHAHGIWWHEQLKDGKWKTHLIDKSFSQTHALWLADINGDGLPDFVTGKRWYAHGGNDPGGKEPAVLYWYEMSRKDGRPSWKRHLIDTDSGIGTQFEVADLNGDGLLDIITSNKKGVHVFHQVRR